MKKITAIFVMLALLPGISFAAETVTTAIASSVAATEVAAVGRIYVVSGKVFVAQGKAPKHPLVNSGNISSDTMVYTEGNSAALIKFDDGQVVTMQANSSFHVQDYRYEPKQVEKSNIAFSVLKGGMRFVTGLIGQFKKDAFKLTTANATIGIRGTEFLVATADGNIYSQVLSGNIGMTNDAGTALLNAGQTAVVTSPGTLAAVVAAGAIPPGIFHELLSLPVNPASIPPVDTAGSVPSVDAAGSVASGAIGTATAAGGGVAGAGTAAATAGIAGAALMGLLSSSEDDAKSSDSSAKPSDASPAKPDTRPEPEAPKSVIPVVVAAPQEKGAEHTAVNSKSGIGLTAKAGTLGYGAELSLARSERFSGRLGFNTFTYKNNANADQVNYDFEFKLKTVGLLADWYPFTGSFRTSLGIFSNQNKATLSAKPGSAGYIINGTTYTSTEIGTMQGTMEFNKTAPYFGIGWGNPVAKNKGLGFTSDLGVLFQGKPKTSLTTTCGTTSQCAAIQASTAAENTKLQDDLKNFKMWPVLSIGISYQW